MTHETSRTAVTGKGSAGERSVEREFVTAQEVAEATNLHVAVVRRAIDRGDLRAYKLCSRLRIRRDDYHDWIERNTVAP
jgi:excisionase family DNA binding protein